MEQRSIRAVFMRGGTSKAVIFHIKDLPERGKWDPIFLAAIGAPDPNGRHLDGMGGGVTSLAKVCVVGPPTREGADVDFTFAQLTARGATVSYGGNCGNMSSAIGPYAIDEGLVPKPSGKQAVVRIHNTNTNKIVVSHFDMDGDHAAVDGDLRIDGVAGSGAPVKLDFLDPAGAKTGKLLPTGNVEDVLQSPGLGNVRVSLVDSSQPCVFVSAEAMGMRGNELPDEIDANPDLVARLLAVRQHGSVAMGLTPNLEAANAMPGIPLIIAVSGPLQSQTLSGRLLTTEDMDVTARMLSMGQAHRAMGLVVGLCQAVACHIPGSLPNRLARVGVAAERIRIGHASGVLEVGAGMTRDGAGVRPTHATVYRTARRLFQGEVLVRGRAFTG